jgi:hypothetical protein
MAVSSQLERLPERGGRRGREIRSVKDAPHALHDFNKLSRREGPGHEAAESRRRAVSDPGGIGLRGLAFLPLGRLLERFDGPRTTSFSHVRVRSSPAVSRRRRRCSSGRRAGCETWRPLFLENSPQPHNVGRAAEPRPWRSRIRTLPDGESFAEIWDWREDWAHESSRDHVAQAGLLQDDRPFGRRCKEDV